MGSALALRSTQHTRRATAPSALAEHLAELRKSAQVLARQVAEESRHDRDDWLLPTATLYALTKNRGFEHIAFDVRDSTATLPVRWLHRVLIACKNTQVREARLGRTHLTILYDTPTSRGRLALVLQPCARDMDVVVVELGTEPPVVPMQLPAAMRSDELRRPEVGPEVVRLPGPRPSRPIRPTFWGHIDAALGGVLHR